jgi:hypothetical protein
VIWLAVFEGISDLEGSGSAEVRAERWDIQSPGATGCSTGFVGVYVWRGWPLEEVRGGMALGELRLLDAISGDICVSRIRRYVCSL